MALVTIRLSAAPASRFNPNISLSVFSSMVIPPDISPPSVPGTPLILKTASVPPSTIPARPKRLKREAPCKPRANPFARFAKPLNPDFG